MFASIATQNSSENIPTLHFDSDSPKCVRQRSFVLIVLRRPIVIRILYETAAAAAAAVSVHFSCFISR